MIPPFQPFHPASRSPRTGAWILGSLLACSNSWCASVPSEESFLRQVLFRNPSIQVESLSVASARTTREGATTLLLPQFNLGGNASASSSPTGEHSLQILQGTGKATQILPTGGSIEGDLAAGRSSRMSGSIYDTLGIGLSITQPFLRGFGDGASAFYTVDQSRSAERIQLLTSRSNVLALLSQARSAWWKQIALQSILMAHVQDTDRTFRMLRNARQNFAAGAGSLLDTIQSFADHLQARSDWLNSWTSARSGAVDLGSYLDSSDYWIPLPISDTGALHPDSLTRSWPPLDSLLKIAEAGAPEIAQALAQEEKARSERIFRQRESLPSLDAGAFVRHALVPGSAVPGTTIGVQGTFSWDIPDGVDRAAARRAYLDLRKAGVQAAKARKDIRRTLSKLLDLSEQYALSISLQRQLIEAKRVQLLADEQGFRDGSVSWTDLATVRRDWLTAVGAAWNAVAVAQETESDIQSLTGTGAARLGWNWGE